MVTQNHPRAEHQTAGIAPRGMVSLNLAFSAPHTHGAVFGARTHPLNKGLAKPYRAPPTAVHLLRYGVPPSTVYKRHSHAVLHGRHPGNPAALAQGWTPHRALDGPVPPLRGVTGCPSFCHASGLSGCQPLRTAWLQLHCCG